MTVEVETKFVPLMVKVCAAEPAAVEVGDSDVMVGTGLFTVKFIEFDAPPPGAGFVTTTGNVPAFAWSAALSVIEITVELENVTVCATPLYVAVEVVRKFVPLIVNVCAAAPAVAEEGESDVMAGTGLLVTVSVCVGALVKDPLPDAVITGLPVVVSLQ